VTVYLVGAGPGDPGLITRRGAELLAGADVVVFDRLVSPELLGLAPAGAERIDVGKSRGSGRSQREINELLLERGSTGLNVVRLKGGDPFLFGRGGEEASVLQQAGIEFEVVPGVTSALAAPAYAGVPVTHRGLSTSVTIVTGQVGDPAAGGDASSAVDWEAVARVGGTVVVLMGVANRAGIADRLISGGRSPDTPVAVVHWGTTSRQRSVRTTLAGLAGADVLAPSTIVVGPVSAVDLSWFESRPLHGRTVVVTRPRARSGPLSALLRTFGAGVVELPVSEVRSIASGDSELAEAVSEISRYSWVVFTSVNGVDKFMGHLPDARSLAEVRVAAVGRATAAELERHHLVADVVPLVATAESLVEALPDAPAPSVGAGAPRVLYPCAAGARDTVAAGLASKGWEVDEVAAYETVPADVPDGEGWLEADAVTFASPSAVSAFMELAGGRQIKSVVACIGPVTAEAAKRAGLDVEVEAEEHSIEGLVDALVTRFGPALPS
jgi:uroporphyrinogen III methyltransferase/synthase